MDRAASSAGKWALLIGANFYITGNARTDSTGRVVHYHNLNGCVNDVALVECFLKEELGVPDDHITKLTSTKPTDPTKTVPIEDPACWPTYRNMAQAVHRIKEQAKTDDLVYIHYSGHGARVRTAYEKLKGPDGIDEALVPADIEVLSDTDQSRYVRDVEIACWLQEMVDRGLRVTVVLDSCHAGSSNRVSAATPRGTGIVDYSALPSDAVAGSEAAPTGRLRRPPDEGCEGFRDARVRKSWLLEASGYTFLAACTAYQRAHERAFDGEKHGVLTYCLIDALRSGPTAVAPSALLGRVGAMVQSYFTEQTPLVEGEDGTAFFGIQSVPRASDLRVLAVNAGSNTVRLDQGDLHGVRVGTDYAIHSGESASGGSEPLVRVRVTRVLGLESVAMFVDTPQADTTSVRVGQQASLAKQAREGQAIVRLMPSQNTWLREFARSVEGRGHQLSSPWRLATDDSDNSAESPTFTVTVTDDGYYELQDASQARILNLPHLRSANGRSAQDLSACISHVARFNLVQRLGADRASALKTPCRFELVGKSATPPEPPSKPGDFSATLVFPAGLEPAPRGSDGVHTVRHGEVVYMVFRNEGTAPVYLTLLDLKPLWGIEKLYPEGAGQTECVGPGEARHLPIQMKVPDALLEEGRTEITEICKAVVTQRPTSLDLLELPDIGRESYRTSQAGSAEFATMLDQLLENLASENRDVRLKGRSGGSWQVHDVRIRTVNGGHHV